MLSPHFIDVVLLLTMLEFAALVIWHRRTGRGLAPSTMVAVLLPGLCLMLGIRAAVAGAAWPWVPVCLLAALAAHLVDLALRFRR